MAAPAVTVEHQRQGQFVEVVDDYQMFGNPHFADHGKGAFGAANFVAMRRVHQHRQVELLGQLQLRGEEAVLFGSDVVIADFPTATTPSLTR